ncbi:hypothetical protein AXG93_868s1030 [Marchantia polymorpha subsp. ruderalis]|uniref:Uncharacterized protein n=1 Tax=Marchantia polymorpha subsp. ruderalis TaxID=1480154 RepID=A0A176VN97_MARPO|nr:hypothetical protein AXG93_868s1030 [Marchantia polymorpha subsp. ruderalis]
MHAEKLAKVEARRAKEACIAEDLRGNIAEAKTAEEELRSTIAELTNERDKKFKRAEELTASLAEKIWKHEGDLTDWAMKLADCADISSDDDVTATSDGTALKSSLPQAVDIPRPPL